MAERIETDGQIGMKIQVSGPKHGGHFFVTATDVYNSDQGPAGEVIERQEVYLKRFALARHGTAEDILIGGSRIEKVHADQLPLATEEQKLRCAASLEVALDRQDRCH